MSKRYKKKHTLTLVAVLTLLLAAAAVGCLVNSRYMYQNKATRLQVMQQEAEAYKAETVSQAMGDVANFTSVYEKYALNKEITRRRLIIEAMEKVLKNADSKTIISSGSVY